MEIKKNQIDELNAELTIHLEKADYEPTWKKALREYSQQMTMPGFRKGHIPIGLVKKQYGKALLAEEMNKVLSSTLQTYITENKLNVLGNPLPKESGDEGNWDEPDAFTFSYELGLAPEISLDLGKKVTFTQYKVKVDDSIIEQQSKDIARRYGSLSEPEQSEDNDLLMVTLIELEGKEIKAGGIMNDSTISIEFVKDKKSKKALIGLKVGDTVDIDLNTITENHDDLGRMLGIDHQGVHDLDSTVFRAKVKEVKRLQPAELNQELFDKLYGEGEVSTEEGFKTRVKADLEKSFARDANNLFRRQVSDVVVEKINPSLPDEFLKRWIQLSNEKPITKEELDKDYPNYARGLKWQLIENVVVKDKNIEISNDEVLDQAKQEAIAQFQQYGINLEGEQLEGMAKEKLNNKDEIKRIYDFLYERKTVDALAELGKINEKEVSYDTFVEIANSLG